MSDYQTRVSAEGVAGVGGWFMSLATTAMAAYDTLTQGFTELGAAWGGDAPGSAFWSVYESAATQAMDNVLQVPYQIKDVAARVVTTSHGYAATEEHNAQATPGVWA